MARNNAQAQHEQEEWSGSELGHGIDEEGGANDEGHKELDNEDFVSHAF